MAEHDLTHDLALKIHLEELEHRTEAQHMVLCWLLAQMPNHQGLRFMCGQANELAKPWDENHTPSTQMAGLIAELDNIIEGVRRLQTPPDED